VHAYHFISAPFSFVYAVAVTHVLPTVGEIIMASTQIRLSWLNSDWMLAASLVTCAWWISVWDVREQCGLKA
jgi:hypothetical protein